MIQRCLCILAVVSSFQLHVLAAARKPATRPIEFDGRSGRLTYNPDINGDRVPDFSYAGYRASDVPIPNVPIRIVVPPVAGDNTARIQSAIDQVAAMPLDDQGFRGAVLLEKGRYEVDGSLHISASGVVLR